MTKAQHLIGVGLHVQRSSPLSSRWEHGSIQVDVRLEELKVLHLDPKEVRSRLFLGSQEEGLHTHTHSDTFIQQLHYHQLLFFQEQEIQMLDPQADNTNIPKDSLHPISSMKNSSWDTPLMMCSGSWQELAPIARLTEQSHPTGPRVSALYISPVYSSSFLGGRFT